MRVVSLLPAATDLVTALGAEASLVAVSHACAVPPEVSASLARVTASALHASDSGLSIDEAVRALAGRGAPLFTLSEARIAALRPELIITQAVCAVCAVSEGDVRRLAARLVPEPLVVALAGTTLEGIFADAANVACALGLEARWAALRTALDARLRAVHDRLTAVRAPRPRVAVLEWTDPVFAAGHWVPEMVRRAGGTDVLATAGEHSTRRVPDHVAAADPDVVLIAPCGYDVTAAEGEARRLLGQREWAWLDGRRVWAVDAKEFVSRPGPRIVAGVELFARIFHPTLFDPVRDDEARLIDA